MEDGLASYALLSLGSLFAVLSPFATVPPFLAMTQDDSPAQRITMARRACTIGCSVLVVFSLTGVSVLGFFRVSIPAFQIAGGLVLLRVAFEMLQGSRALKVTPEERIEGAQKDDVSITPLGIPILCGPATITTGILLSSQAPSWLHTSILVANAGVIYGTTFLVLRFAAIYSDWLGETAIKIISRLMGLLLLSIAVQFVLDGLRQSGLLPAA